MSLMNELTISGFKSIWQQTLDLGQLNVFIGTNGAGKSNLLEAIAMLSSSVDGGIDYERMNRRGARLSSPEIFRSAFRNKERKKTLTIKAKFGTLEYNMSVHAAKGFAYNSESLKDGNKKLAGRSNNGATINGEPLKTRLDQQKSILTIYQAFENSVNEIVNLQKYAIYAPATPILRGTATDTVMKEPLGLYGGRLAEALREVLDSKEKRDELKRFFKLLDWFKQIGVSNEKKKELLSDYIDFLGNNVVRFKDKYMTSTFNDLYAYDVSEGALYILFVLVLLTHEDAPNMFALDNIDNALNPGLISSLMNNIVDILKEKPKKQIFLTTHNPSTLDGIDLFNDTHRLFIVSRSEDGQTIFKRFLPPKDMTKAQWSEKYYGLKLSEIWLSGAIGGLPKGF